MTAGEVETQTNLHLEPHENTRKNNGTDRETLSLSIAREIHEFHIQMLELIGR